MSDMLTIEALGGLLIKKNNQVINFVSHKAEALVLYLLHHQKTHSREVLAELFWSEYSQERALSNLRNLLSNIQQYIPDHLEITRKVIAFNFDSPYYFDVADLTGRLNDLFQQPNYSHSMSYVKVQKLEQALALYKASFLQGFYIRGCNDFELWKNYEQDKLQNMVIAGWRTLINYYFQHGKYTQGIHSAKQLLYLDPLNEDTYAQLMLMLASSKQRKEAIEIYHSYEQMLRNELVLEPKSEVTDLYHEILRGTFQEPQKTTRDLIRNLPTFISTYIERPQEIAQINEKLDNPECRLLTLLGMGGAGKTRLAVQVAQLWNDDFRDGVYYVGLAAIEQPIFLLDAIAHGFNLSGSGTDDTEAQLLAYLKGKQLLLILDNFEHMLAGTPLISKILSGTTHLKILITSRERLYLQEEWLVPIDGMRLPDQLDPQVKHPALLLFEQTVQRIQPSFSLAENYAEVVQICRLVDCIPLAIELAAGWMRVLSCSQVRANIETDLGFLHTNLQNTEPRHRSIYALLAYSWEMLTLPEKEMLRRIALFHGAFSAEAAYTISGASMSIFTGLVEKSLIQRLKNEQYSLHQLLRRFALEKLVEAGELETFSQQHHDYFMQLAQQLAKDGTAGFDQIQAGYSDFQVALHWAFQSKSLEHMNQLITALAFFWDSQNYLQEAECWTSKAMMLIDSATPPLLQSEIYIYAGIFASSQGRYEIALTHLEKGSQLAEQLGSEELYYKALLRLGTSYRSLQKYDQAQAAYEAYLHLARQREDPAAIGRALSNLGNLKAFTGAYEAAHRDLEEALAIYKNLNITERLNTILCNLGILAFQQQNYPEAEKRFRQALEAARQSKERINVAIALMNLGEARMMQDDDPQALQFFRESLEDLRSLQSDYYSISVIENIARLELRRNYFDRALLLLSAAEASRQNANLHREPDQNEVYAQTVAALREKVVPHYFEQYWRIGSSMSLGNAIKLALDKHLG